jgi:hypothetical protein
MTNEESMCFQRELLYVWRFTANQFVLATSPLSSGPVIFFQLNTCGYSAFVTSFLHGRLYSLCNHGERLLLVR